MKIIEISDDLFHLQLTKEQLLFVGQIFGNISGISKFRSVTDYIYDYCATKLGMSDFGDSVMIQEGLNFVISDKPSEPKVNPPKAKYKHTIRDYAGRYAKVGVKILYPTKEFRPIWNVEDKDCEWRYLSNYRETPTYIEGFDIKKGEVRKFLLHKCKEVVECDK